MGASSYFPAILSPLHLSFVGQRQFAKPEYVNRVRSELRSGWNCLLLFASALGMLRHTDLFLLLPQTPLTSVLPSLQDIISFYLFIFSITVSLFFYHTQCSSPISLIPWPTSLLATTSLFSTVKSLGFLLFVLFFFFVHLFCFLNSTYEWRIYFFLCFLTSCL